MDSKGGQLTIFVIIAILIVFVIFIYFYWASPDFLFSRFERMDFDSCVLEAFDKEIEKLSLTGGIENGPSFKFRGDSIPYYCYTNIPYTTCTVQHPMVKQSFERQLLKKMEQRVNECYEDSVEDLRERGFEVITGEVEVNLTIIPKRINVEIKAPTAVEGQRFVNYRMNVDSPIYDLLMIATSILQYEASYGDAPISEFMFYYNNIIVDKLKQGDSTTIYIISDKNSDLKFQFASRSLIWPAGYDVVTYEV